MSDQRGNIFPPQHVLLAHFEGYSSVLLPLAIMDSNHIPAEQAAPLWPSFSPRQPVFYSLLLWVWRLEIEHMLWFGYKMYPQSPVLEVWFPSGGAMWRDWVIRVVTASLNWPIDGVFTADGPWGGGVCTGFLAHCCARTLWQSTIRKGLFWFVFGKSWW